MTLADRVPFAGPRGHVILEILDAVLARRDAERLGDLRPEGP
jgi:hypothetical protein